MTGRIESWLLTVKEQPDFDKFGSDDFAPFELPTPEQKLEKRRSDLRGVVSPTGSGCFCLANWEG